MATIIERRKKIEKEQRRFARKLRALQAECLHPAYGIVIIASHVEACPFCMWGGEVPEPDLDPFADAEWTGGVQ